MSVEGHAWKCRLSPAVRRVWAAAPTLPVVSVVIGSDGNSNVYNSMQNIELSGGGAAGSRRIVSAVPRTDIEIPALQREVIWRRRQRQQEREHSAHPQSRGGAGSAAGEGNQRGSGPMKPSRPERSGVRSATSSHSGARPDAAQDNGLASGGGHDSDGRAFFTGAAKAPVNSNALGQGDQQQQSQEGHPWSWIRDYPRLERPPSRQRHPTQSLHLSEPFPGGGGWLNLTNGGLDDGAGGASSKKAPSRSSSSYGVRESKQRPVTQENRSPTGTLFGDNMELRPGTSVVAAADDDWAAPRHGHTSTGNNADDSGMSSSASSVRSVDTDDSSNSCTAVDTQNDIAHDGLGEGQGDDAGIEVESLSDSSMYSPSPTHHRGSRDDLKSAMARESGSPTGVGARSPSSREAGGPGAAVKVFRPASRKARSGNPDGNLGFLVSPSASSAAEPLLGSLATGDAAVARPDSARSQSRGMAKLPVNRRKDSKDGKDGGGHAKDGGGHVKDASDALFQESDPNSTRPASCAPAARSVSDNHAARAGVDDDGGTPKRDAKAVRVVQSAKIIRQSRPETARGGGARGQRLLTAGERSTSTLGFYGPSAGLALSPGARPWSSRSPESLHSKGPTKTLDGSAANDGRRSIYVPEPSISKPLSKTIVVKSPVERRGGPAGSDSDEWIGNTSLDRRATGLGETAPDRDFDFGAIGGCPWSGSSSSSPDSSRYLLDGDLNWSDGEGGPEKDLRPDTAPAPYSATMLGDACHVASSGLHLANRANAAVSSSNRANAAVMSSAAAPRARPDSAAAGTSAIAHANGSADVELDPLKRRDPWLNTSTLNPAVRTEGRGAWARPRSAQSAFRPKSAARETFSTNAQ